MKEIDAAIEALENSTPVHKGVGWIKKRKAALAGLRSLTAKQGKQEPGFWLSAENINDLVINSLKDLIRRAKWCSICDVDLRENGKNVRFEADWVKYMEWCDTRPAPEAKQEADSTCSDSLRLQGKPYPRTCKKCGLGPCIGKPITAPVNKQLLEALKDAESSLSDYHAGAPWGKYGLDVLEKARAAIAEASTQPEIQTDTLERKDAELLEALKQLVIATKHLNPCPGTLEMAEKAIKEAEGEVRCDPQR